jgi:batC protein
MKKIQLLVILFPIIVFSQKAEKEVSKAELTKREKAQQQSQAFAYQGYQAEKAHKLLDSEMDYRKAISKNKENAVAQYNMGDVLYSQEAYNEATHYYQEASVNKEASKENKHKAFHNLGNLAMQNKKYEEAVQFYKEALRNNPTDEQTRYNLAIAKEKLKKQQQENKKNQNNQNNQQNKDNKENKDNKDNQNKDNKDNQNKDNKDNKDNQNKDNKDNKDNQNKDNKDNKDNKNQGSPERDKQENNNQDNRESNTPEEGERKELSAEQMNRILNAINNEEKKTQEKLNANKVKGKAKKSNTKDW